MTPKKYEILYADPCWDYKGQVQHGGAGKPYTGGAKAHYPTLSLDKLQALDIPSVSADNALLFMWATSPHLDQAILLLKSWEFEWATVGFVWDKKRVNPGFYTMSQCELCLVGKKGRIPKPRGARNVRQFLSESRTSHSTKPNEVRLRIESMFPNQTKLELFARQKTPGWDVWGNEVESDVIIGERQ